MFDGLTDALYAVAPIWQADDAQAAVEHAGERIDTVLSQLAQAAPQPEQPALPDALPDLEAVVAPDDYKAMALRAKDYILAGDIFQVVLAQRFTCPFPAAAAITVSRAAADKPFALPLFPRFAGLCAGRFQPRDSCPRT